MLGMALGKLLTSAVVKVDWYVALFSLGQCCRVNGSSVFSQGGLYWVYLGDGISQGGCLFLLKERAMLEIGVRPKRRLGVAADVLTVVVFLRSSGFQQLCRGGWGRVKGTWRDHAGGNTATLLLHAIKLHGNQIKFNLKKISVAPPYKV